MIPTAEQERFIEARAEAVAKVKEEALYCARFHERQLGLRLPGTDTRYHVGAIDAYVGILKTIDPHTDWLAHIRATA